MKHAALAGPPVHLLVGFGSLTGVVCCFTRYTRQENRQPSTFVLCAVCHLTQLHVACVAWQTNSRDLVAVDFSVDSLQLPVMTAYVIRML